MIVYQPIPSSSTQQLRSCQQNSGTSHVQNLNSQNYLSLLVIPKDTPSNNLELNQKQPLTSNIPPATIFNNEFLAAIFLFELEKTIPVLLFSGAALDIKPITTMYTNTKVDGHAIKLILNNQLSCQVDYAASVCIITANEATKTLISEIDDLPIEVNSIIMPIKVLVIKAIQYQALVGNDWLSKTNATLDWTTQKLQISQNSQHT
ncbi:hypothetical protein G9A89_010861 [Geosiphon pyriformis]|nr:hypothetical protein G9A89_010861 [Geosiphon pyriformis]